MKRILSQQILCAPGKILRNTVVEQDNQNRITNLIALDNQTNETSNTLFYDGVISSEIISVKFNVELWNKDMISGYQYINFGKVETNSPFLPESKPLLIDFESNDLSVINSILKEKFYLLVNFNIMDIIAACTFYPNLLLNLSKELKLSSQTQLIHWKKINFSSEGKNPYLQVSLV